MKPGVKGLVLGCILFIGLVLPAFAEEFVGSVTSNRYHLPSCKWAKTIKPKKAITFASPEEASKAGYVPCPRCKPPVRSAAAPAKPASEAVKPETAEIERLYARGKILFQEKNYHEALLCFEEIVAKDPRHGEAYFQIGVCNSQLGRYGEAIDAYKEAVSLQRDHAAAYYNMALSYAATKKMEEAAAAFMEVVRINPNSNLVYNNLGVVFANLSRDEEALRAFGAALRTDPYDTFALYNQGLIYVRLADYRKAIGCFRAVLGIKPDDEMARYQLGMTFLKSGDRESSLKEYRALLEKRSGLALQLHDAIRESEAKPEGGGRNDG